MARRAQPNAPVDHYAEANQVPLIEDELPVDGRHLYAGLDSPDEKKGVRRQRLLADFVDKLLAEPRFACMPVVLRQQLKREILVQVIGVRDRRSQMFGVFVVQLHHARVEGNFLFAAIGKLLLLDDVNRYVGLARRPARRWRGGQKSERGERAARQPHVTAMALRTRTHSQARR